MPYTWGRVPGWPRASGTRIANVESQSIGCLYHGHAHHTGFSLLNIAGSFQLNGKPSSTTHAPFPSTLALAAASPDVSVNRDLSCSTLADS